MGIEAILGGVAFIGLFALWVLLPSWVRRNPKPSSRVRGNPARQRLATQGRGVYGQSDGEIAGGGRDVGISRGSR